MWRSGRGRLIRRGALHVPQLHGGSGLEEQVEPGGLGVAHGVTGALDFGQQQTGRQASRVGTGQGGLGAWQHHEVRQAPGRLPAFVCETGDDAGQGRPPEGLGDALEIVGGGPIPAGSAEGGAGVLGPALVDQGDRGAVA